MWDPHGAVALALCANAVRSARAGSERRGRKGQPQSSGEGRRGSSGKERGALVPGGAGSEAKALVRLGEYSTSF